MKYLRIAGLTAIIALAATTSWGATSKGIEGSPHDFSSTNGTYGGTWASRNGVCSPCHAAHNTDPAQIVPLWIHETSKANFTPYNSPTFNAGQHTPSGVSLACLSCHDGTVAINQSIGGTYTNGNPDSRFITDPKAVIGPDLHTTHPISFTYDTALATADGGLELPSYKIGDPKTRLTIQTAPVPAPSGSVPTGWTGTSLTGKRIDEALLIDGKMECASCHDVHKMEGSAPSSGILARISGSDSDGRGSTLCRTCHVK